MGGAKKSARSGALGRAPGGAFAMLEDSHRQLAEEISRLQRAASAIVRERAGDGELVAVDSVLAYLERQALRHETDEEESLFPRLRRFADLAPLIDDLASQHQQHRQLVLQLRALRSGWSAGGPDAGDGAALVIATNELARAYRAHMEREERELIPAARDELGAAECAAMLGEMERRHGRRVGGPKRRPASSAPRVRVL